MAILQAGPGQQRQDTLTADCQIRLEVEEAQVHAIDPCLLQPDDVSASRSGGSMIWILPPSAGDRVGVMVCSAPPGVCVADETTEIGRVHVIDDGLVAWWYAGVSGSVPRHTTIGLISVSRHCRRASALMRPVWSGSDARAISTSDPVGLVVKMSECRAAKLMPASESMALRMTGRPYSRFPVTNVSFRGHRDLAAALPSGFGNSCLRCRARKLSDHP
jgi:hypothetical protein